MPTQRLSTWVALRCREPEFQRFLRVPDKETAASSVRAICEVKSRAEIDTNPEAEKRFHQYVRLPYLEFTNNRTQDANDHH